jgi:hypothetical protein
MRWITLLILPISLYAEESSTIHQGFYQESSQQAVIQATTHLFQDMAENECVPECVRAINKRFKEAYPEPTPVQMNIDPGTGLVSIKLRTGRESLLVPSRGKRFSNNGDGRSGNNGKTPMDPPPPPGPMFAIVIILTVAFWAAFIWWLINRW